MERERVPGEEPDKETEMERRSGPDQMREVEPYPPRERGMAVYGDTDMDPNRDDQASAHRATEDEHL